jgi:peptide/nickel transport system permease protein
VGLVLLVLILLGAVFAPWLAPYDPLDFNPSNRLLPPGLGHWLGTDSYGRDILSRILWGSRTSMWCAATAIVIGTMLGTLIGLCAGYFGGRVDSFLMGWMDIMMAFPTVLLAIAIVVVLGTTLFNLALAIGISNTPRFARLVRGEVIRVKSFDFVDGALALGASTPRIIISHILPNILPSLIVMVSLRVSVAILTEASLNFLGLGVPPPAPTWGGMVSEGQKFLLFSPWLAISPGVAIGLIVLALNFVGDGLRDALDPRLKNSEI